MLIAHRGFGSIKGEARYIDFENALKYANGIEFDIRLTKDQKIIIFHDQSFERIGNDSSNVIDLTYDQIRNLKFFKENQEFLPPLFVEFMDKHAQKYKLINVEVKFDHLPQISSSQVKIMFDAIKKYSYLKKTEIIVSSFGGGDVFDQLLALPKPFKKGYLFFGAITYNQKIGTKFDYLQPPANKSLGDLEDTKLLKKLKKPLILWNYKTQAEVDQSKKVFGKLIYGCISDNPHLKC